MFWTCLYSHLLLQEAEQQLQAVVRPQLSARALRAVRHAADKADGQRPQLRALLPLPHVGALLRLQSILRNSLAFLRTQHSYSTQHCLSCHIQGCLPAHAL